VPRSTTTASNRESAVPDKLLGPFADLFKKMFPV
jgi:hypothetical protein